jgi:hypothetical protein
VTLIQAGTCHGWLSWFQMRLLDEWLSTVGKPDATHWSPVFLPLAQCVTSTSSNSPPRQMLCGLPKTWQSITARYLCVARVTICVSHVSGQAKVQAADWVL